LPEARSLAGVWEHVVVSEAQHPNGRDGEPRISYLVARLERAVRSGIAERVAPHGVTTAQYTTLSILGARSGLSNAQLARRALITPQSMSEVLHALEGKGLVARDSHPSHGRILPAKLTRQGRAVLAACDRAVDELEDEMLRELAGSDRSALRACLLSATRSLHHGHPER
jgi:DNA-binding MarR family transcriptional regulator